MINIFNTIFFLIIFIIFIIWLINKLNIKNYNLYINKFFIINNLLDIFPILLLIFIIRSFIYEPFQIPSASMMPTLLIGDLILVNKFKYNIKNPITNNTIINIGKPKYGDIIVFQYPLNKKIYYIKRIIGLPGDKIIFNKYNNKIKLYKYCKNKKNFCKKNIIKYSNEKQSKFIEEIRYKNNIIKEYFWENNELNNLNINFKNNSKYIFLIEKNEYINKKIHKILIIPNIYKKNNKKKNKIMLIIPKNMYFVMGDYRDNSEDSRYWGFLNKDLIIGKAEFIWLSFKKQENSLPTGIRFNQIGKIN